MPSAGTRRHRQLKLLILAGVACVAFFLGRVTTWPRSPHDAHQGKYKKIGQVHETRTGGQQLPRITAFIGVQTGFNAKDAEIKYNYELRRQQLRKTWFPQSRSMLQKLEDDHGIVARFVIGHSIDTQQELRLQKEMRDNGDFLQLGISESYLSLATKTLNFFSTVSKLYNARYILKVDDDVYLRLDRVPSVVAQWEGLGADYIGCMKTGAIQTNPRYRWYEPLHLLLGGKTYFAHTWGSFYVLSGSTATFLATLPPSKLRFLSNEDVTIGGWMLALNTSHYDDRRMCEPSCSATSVAVYDFPKCAGLCDASVSLPLLWAQPECRDGPLKPQLRPQSWMFPDV